MPLTLEELTDRMHRFVEGQGWYEPESPRPQTLRNLATSLSIEAAEVLEHVQWQDDPLDREGWRDELADVLLFLLQLASLSGVSLEAAALDKLDRNARRTWQNGVKPG